jgi:hypothetical protein
MDARVIGAVLGGVLGGVLAYVSLDYFEPSGGLLALLALFGGAGAVIGAVVGMQINLMKEQR